jgi:hypothetical protein
LLAFLLSGIEKRFRGPGEHARQLRRR